MREPRCCCAAQVTGKKFVPLVEAPEVVKKMNGGKSELHMQVRTAARGQPTKGGPGELLGMPACTTK